MDRVRRLLLGLLLALGLLRVAGYFVYAATCLPFPLEVFHLEAKMVLLAYRAQAGLTLYPDWRNYPHVANFFAPLYFMLAGLVGAATGADVPGLFRIGRALSFGSALLTTLMLGAVVGRRYGRRAGLAAAVFSLGAAPMFGFSIMVRPDLMAETLGLGGFFLSGHRSLAARVGAVILLTLAILTKQTAVVFLLAAALAPFAERDWRRALELLAGCAILLLGLIVGITALVEPNFVPAILGESRTTWDFADWLSTLGRMAGTAPDLFLIPVAGLCLWTGRDPAARNPRWAVLTAVVVASSLGLSGKKGADLNYYLSLRASEALAIGTLWHASAAASARGRVRSLALMAVAAMAIAAMVPGTVHSARQALSARNQAAFFAGPMGRYYLRSYQRLISLARAPDFHLLTDSGLLDLYQGDRALFGDPWLFRMLVDTGRINPTLVKSRIDSGYYDLIATTSDLNSPDRATHAFGMPAALAVRARDHYALIRTEAGLFLYGRRQDPAR